MAKITRATWKGDLVHLSYKSNNFHAFKIVWHNLDWMRYYKEPPLYDQCMDRLRCKIWHEHCAKPMPTALARSSDQDQKYNFLCKDAYKRNVISRFSQQPFDLDDDKNPNYYTNNPQVRSLTFLLREYGLFRDEHLDFQDEMKRSKMLRGRYRKWKEPRPDRK